MTRFDRASRTQVQPAFYAQVGINATKYLHTPAANTHRTHGPHAWAEWTARIYDVDRTHSTRNNLVSGVHRTHASEVDRAHGVDCGISSSVCWLPAFTRRRLREHRRLQGQDRNLGLELLHLCQRPHELVHLGRVRGGGERSIKDFQRKANSLSRGTSRSARHVQHSRHWPCSPCSHSGKRAPARSPPCSRPTCPRRPGGPVGSTRCRSRTRYRFTASTVAAVGENPQVGLPEPCQRQVEARGSGALQPNEIAGTIERLCKYLQWQEKKSVPAAQKRRREAATACLGNKFHTATMRPSHSLLHR